MTEPSPQLLAAILALAERPARSESELQLPPVNPYTRAEHSAFVEGALYANDWLMDAWRKLEDNNSGRFAEAVQQMLVDLMNTIGEQARLEAEHRYPSFSRPSANELALGLAPISVRGGRID